MVLHEILIEFFVFKHLIVNQIKSHVGSYPCPININFMWNFGFMVSFMFIIQIFTGIVLSIYYIAEGKLAFFSVSYILREVGSGWFFRYFHSNGASFVFMFIYLHMLRSLVFKSYIYLPTAWLSGFILFLVTMCVAFLGYVLPWGQMSFWAATVITNLFKEIPALYKLVVGGFYVFNLTLKRFYVLHFILPIISICIIIVHIYFIHLHGSNNPLGTDTNLKVSFYPNVILLDAKGLNCMILMILYQSCFGILELSHFDNSKAVNILLTPALIVPEWYFLPFYGILKSIPNKLCGILILISVILSLILLKEARSVSNSLIKWYNYRSTNWSIYMIYCMYCLLRIGESIPHDIYFQFGRIFIDLLAVFIILILGGVVTSGVFQIIYMLISKI